MDTHQSAPQQTTVFAGGELLATPCPDAGGLVIAADSGYDHALSAEYHVDVLVGDLDSISEDGLAHAETHDVVIERHPASKDATDLALALDAAAARGAPTVDIYGGEAGLTDHLLGVAVGLTDSRWSGVDINWHTADAIVRPLLAGGHIHLEGDRGTPVSFIAVTDSAGVTTQGLKWRLAGESLRRGTSRAMRNEIIDHPATVSIDAGALLVVTGFGGKP